MKFYKTNTPGLSELITDLKSAPAIQVIGNGPFSVKVIQSLNTQDWNQISCLKADTLEVVVNIETPGIYYPMASDAIAHHKIQVDSTSGEVSIYYQLNG